MIVSFPNIVLIFIALFYTLIRLIKYSMIIAVYSSLFYHKILFLITSYSPSKTYLVNNIPPRLATIILLVSQS